MRFLLLLAAAVTGGFAPLNAPALFEEVPASRSGISWVHENAMSDDRHLPESVGPGCAFLDYDNDGRLDIYLVNYGPSDFYRPPTHLRNALYRNNGDGTFSDRTLAAGVAGGTFGMGAAAGDFDNDGFTDLFVTAYGKCILYRNRGDGTFEDVTAQAGLETPGWTTSAVWFDFDRDGLLDLFVCSYVDYSLEKSVYCGDDSLGGRFYCVPTRFKPTSSFLYRNRGGGRFDPAHPGTVIAASPGKALGVVATDIDNNGWMDLFVANDTAPNFLFVNRGEGKWEEIGLPAEVGYSGDGQARSGMGVDAADVDGDGRQDLFVANIDGELFSLYLNNGDATFRDAAPEHGIARATRALSGWGLKFADFNNDGSIDLFLANGHPNDRIELYSSLVKHREPLLFFLSDGRRLQNRSAEAGGVFSKSFPARGLAVGDYDNDGRLDVLVANNGEAPLLLHNRSSEEHRWIGLQLQGTRAARQAVGALIRWSAGGVVRSRLKTSGGSYLASHDPREILGLGTASLLEWVEITWPGPEPSTERFSGLPTNSYVTLTEGQGEAAP